MKILGLYPQLEQVELYVESRRDIVRLSELMEVGDMIKGATHRNRGKPQAQTSIKLTQPVLYDKQDPPVLHLVGTIQPENVATGSLSVTCGDTISFSKATWYRHQLSQLERLQKDDYYKNIPEVSLCVVLMPDYCIVDQCPSVIHPKERYRIPCRYNPSASLDEQTEIYRPVIAALHFRSREYMSVYMVSIKEEYITAFMKWCKANEDIDLGNVDLQRTAKSIGEMLYNRNMCVVSSEEEIEEILLSDCPSNQNSINESITNERGPKRKRGFENLIASDMSCRTIKGLYIYKPFYMGECDKLTESQRKYMLDMIWRLRPEVDIRICDENHKMAPQLIENGYVITEIDYPLSSSEEINYMERIQNYI